jgi:hypothetical protein
MNIRLKNFRWMAAGAVIAVMAASSVAHAAITAKLSRNQTSVGIPVQFMVEVDGSTNVILPQSIPVEGLQIQRTGQQTRVEIINFRMKTSAVYSFTIYPDREGVFEIPSIDVTVDGKLERTRPLELRVDAGSPGTQVQRAIPVTPGQGIPGQAPPPATNLNADPSEERLAFAEIILPKESVFVGEVVPVEVRFYFNQGYQFEISGNRPSFSGEGFTVQRLPDPQRSEQQVGNANYHVFSFRTSITPLKSGQIEIPAVTLDCITRVPMSSMGNIDDIFDQFFGGSGMPGLGQARQLTVASEPTQLTVKPLPKEGRPANFSGAVGDFTLSSDATPDQVGPGEPVTLSVTVAGRGNFDAMGDPVLMNEDGWQSYPPTQNFKPDDTIGYGGRKQFDFMLVARRDQIATPGAEFSFFNPEREEYVTLTAEPVAVQAIAAMAADTNSGAVAPTEPGVKPEPASLATPEEVAGPSIARGFSPWIRSGGAWILNALVAIAVLVLIVTGWIRKHSATDAGILSQRKRTRRALIGNVARASDKEFADAVVKVLEFDAETSGQFGAWTRVDAIAADPRHAESAERLRQFLSAVDESRFGGGTQQSRQQLLESKFELISILKKVQP